MGSDTHAAPVGTASRSLRTARKRKLPDGPPQPTRLLICPGTRSTSGLSMPRRGCPHTAPGADCARSTARNPGIPNSGPQPSITIALSCTPNLRMIQGGRSDQHARHLPAQTRRPPTVHTATDPQGDRQERRDCTGADSFPDHGSGQSRSVRAWRHHRPRAAITVGAEGLRTTAIAEALGVRAAGFTAPNGKEHYLGE